MKARPKRIKKKSILWVTDPWGTLEHRGDTSLRLLLEAARQGHESHFCDAKNIRWENGRTSFDAFRVTEGFEQESAGRARPCDYDQIHYRVDPPVDLEYLYPLQLLFLDAGRAEIVNPPEILALRNEKTEAARLGKLMPPSLVSANWEEILAFGSEEGQTVLKPLNQAQSKGVELLKWNSADEIRRARKLLEVETLGFAVPVVLQRYLQGIAEGETRLWYIDGKLLAQSRKLPMAGDFRVNIDQGSSIAKTKLAARDRAAAAKIGKHLKACGIRLAAVDLIDGYVTDFNFTSPGLIPQMEKLLGADLAGPIVRALTRA